MHNHSDGGSDLVASFDAFKVVKNIDHVPGKIVTWSVRPLTSWACDLIRAFPRERASEVRAVFVGMGDHAIFDTRSDALDFLRELERIGAMP